MKRTIEQIYDADQSMVPNWAMCQKKNTCKLQLYRHAQNTEQTDSHTHIYHESKNTAQ